MSASLQTPFCRGLGLTAPIVQAPVGSATTPELAAAVSNAGGLGMLALSWTPAGSVGKRIRATRALTDRPFGVNVVLEWDQRERVRACVEEGVAVVSTFWGDPRPYVDAIHACGALHAHTVGSAEEALRAVEAGVDVIVAQGWEAGGRVRGEVATLALVPAVVNAVRPVPVLAAGGVADGRGLAAVLVLGAEAAWVGTRFLLAQEASVHDEWRRRIQDASETSTLYSTLFDRGWQDAPHRTLRNSTVQAWERAGRPAAPRRPGEGDVVARAPDGTGLYRYGLDAPVGGTSGGVEALALYAGQSAGIVNEVLPAAAIVDQLIGDAAAALGLPGPPDRPAVPPVRAGRLPDTPPAVARHRSRQPREASARPSGQHRLDSQASRPQGQRKAVKDARPPGTTRPDSNQSKSRGGHHEQVPTR